MSRINGPIRVLVVDDSAVMRGILKTLFQAYAETAGSGHIPIELCGMAEDGVACLAAVTRLRPDVLLLDLEMPRMHGLDVLERLRSDEPALPVIMCSSYTEMGARTTLDALALGARDYVMKPSEQLDFASAMESLSSQLLPKIVAVAGSAKGCADGALHFGETPKRPRTASRSGPRVEMVVIGVSTGGPSALEQVLPKLAASFPVPIMIVQHMPKLFTGALAERLDHTCLLRVREAYDGAQVVPGTIWIAPGDAHMEVRHAANASRSMLGREHHSAIAGRSLEVRLHQQRSLNHCKPSVDYLFTSAARIFGQATLALVMTGMGSDGLTGARCVHAAGGTVLAQDEATSAVWGMPARVFQAGLARDPVPLESLAHELTVRAGCGRSGESSKYVPNDLVAPSRRGLARLDPEDEVMHGLL